MPEAPMPDDDARVPEAPMPDAAAAPEAPAPTVPVPALPADPLWSLLPAPPMPALLVPLPPDTGSVEDPPPCPEQSDKANTASNANAGFNTLDIKTSWRDQLRPTQLIRSSKSLVPCPSVERFMPAA